MKIIITLALIVFLSGCQTVSFNPDPALFQKDNGVAFQISSHHPTEGDAWTIKPGETKVLMEDNGPAIIRNIWFTLGGGPDASHGVDLLRKLTIRMFWDDEESPSVEAPFGDFFGNGFGIYKPFYSQYIGINYIVNDHNGIFKVEIDGQQIGSDIDGYSDDPMDAYLLCRNKASGLKHLGKIDLVKGKHKIKITAVGKNKNSKGYKAIIDCVTVE